MWKVFNSLIDHCNNHDNANETKTYLDLCLEKGIEEPRIE